MPQVFDLSSSTEFADLGGGPPQARYVAVVLRFLVLSGLLDDPYRVHWSGLNAITTWTPGTNQSDFQDFPDGGVVRGLAGGEVGLIMQDGAIRRMVYSRGSPDHFRHRPRLRRHRHSGAALAHPRRRPRVLLSSKGFFMMTPTGGSRCRSARSASTVASPPMSIPAASSSSSAPPTRRRAASTGRTSRSPARPGCSTSSLPYDWALDRWAPPIAISGEYLAALARPGLTLENLDSISGSLDALTFSLDDVSTAAIPHLPRSTRASARLLQWRRLEAMLETPEQGADGAADLCARFPADHRRGDCVRRGQAPRQRAGRRRRPPPRALIDAQGFCPQRIDTRYARAKLRIPAGTAWSFAMGVEPDFTLEGRR